MIDDLAAYEAGAELEADLCVVGAGAAGLAIAREFLGSAARVVVVESGGLGPEPETDRLKEGEVDGLDPAALVDGRGRGFGGTTALWAGQCIPLDDIDFERREWVPHSGWPIAASDLADHYARAAELFDVPGETYGESLWGRWGSAPPGVARDRLRHTYTAWSPRPDLGRALRRDFERSANVRVLLHANVTQVATSGAGAAFDHLAVRHLDGTDARVRARACVLSAGGVENARLLLMSGDPEAGGLANPHGAVGRYFQDHPNARSAVLRSPSPRTLQEAYGLFYRRRRRYLPKLALAPEVQRRERVLNCGANLEYDFADEALNAMRRMYRGVRSGGAPAGIRRELAPIARGLPAAAATAYRRLAHGRSSLAAPATIWLQTHTEQSPNPDSRVVLSRQRDAVGSNRARVEWRLTDLERRTAEVMARTVEAEFRRLGLASTELAGWVEDSAGAWVEHCGDSYHHLGTTRMADDPAHGVVDRNSQVHGVAGLYAAGGSVFPTSGFANPTLTIAALSLRLADHLRRRL
ncbi:MAG TPA: GMC oxidoreductase [Thermoleophilaceae bacterium]|jgi:choline dehydrogenase-like flavoprotein